MQLAGSLRLQSSGFVVPMLSDAAGRAQVAVVPSQGVLSALLRPLGQLFDVTSPVDRVRATHWVALAVIAIACAAVRFVGLGSVGLHGDEETMAMAVRHILEDGTPILPSGMFYPRGMTQLYLMALSASIFGETEWALRLPSVLCGILLVPIAFLAGQRFLRPKWNLAFAASVAFLPTLIVDSQTARMYIFLVAAVLGSMACLFKWERTDELRWLIASIVVLIIGIDMHALAVACVLMFLLPGAVQGDARKLTYGTFAAAIVTVAYFLIDGWVNAQYPVPPPEFAAAFGPPPWERARAPQEFALTFDIALWVAGLVTAFLGLQTLRSMNVRAGAIAAGVLLLAGLCFQLALFYHLAAIAYAAGIVVARRYASSHTVNWRLIIFVMSCAVIALIHVTVLASKAGSVLKLIGSLVGQPSVWPYVRIAQMSVMAGVLTAVLVLWGAVRLAYHKTVPDYWLLACLGVWAPVFALGLFAWNVPSRYTEMSLAPMLLCAVAVAQRGADWLSVRMPALRKLEVVLAGVLAILIVNPVDAARVVNAGYRLYPDHKGAAEFLRSQQLRDDDIVLAEDILQQTYYLGRVDYWLIGGNIARKFVKSAEGGVVDFYTGTPVIATQAMLDEVLQNSNGRRVFVIGSGEQQSDHRRSARGPELHDAIESNRFETIYVGRDGLTRVLRAVPGAVDRSRETIERAERDADDLAREAQAAEEAAASGERPLLPRPDLPPARE